MKTVKDINKMTKKEYYELKEDVHYIRFLNKKKNFQEDVKTFSSYKKAKKWGIKNLENFHIDMIK